MAVKNRNNAQLKNRFQGRIFRSAKSVYQSLTRAPSYADKQVVLIAGVQRSGTNMITEILERSLETNVFRESDPRAYKNFELHPIAQIEALVRKARSGTIVFKSLCELQDIRTILNHFPNGKVIWMYRRMEDMVNSHLRSVFVSSRRRSCNLTMQNILINPNSEGWRGRGMSDETYQILKDHINPRLTHETAVALFWLMRNRLYFELGLDTDTRARAISYERFAQNPEGYGRALLEWLELNISEFTFKKVNAKSIGKNTPPPIDPSVRDICKALYERFENSANLLECHSTENSDKILQ